jgi:hypothetical protein
LCFFFLVHKTPARSEREANRRKLLHLFIK